MKMYKMFFLFTLVMSSWSSSSQESNFDIDLQPISIDQLGGLQSYAIGVHEGHWVLFGGRLDGLHRRQPFASFDVAGHNNQILIINPNDQKVYKRSMAELPVGIKEQLSSTNMQFFQQANTLYIIGGYGYSSSLGDHTTYNSLIAINLESLYLAILNQTPITTAFRQVKDDRLQVTGGYLGKIGDRFYLVGGQKFLGRYNPMGPDHGPGFTQEYTDAIRKFEILDDGQQLIINNFEEWKNPEQLHRRDYNLVPQIMTDRTEGLTAFSGVFQINADLPFLDCVNISKNGYKLQSDFLQYYNHYHCAHVPMFSEASNEMTNLFFGGIAQYYHLDDMLIKDDNVPFVKTIAKVVRDKNGRMTEHKLVNEMPSFLGAGAEFIPLESMPKYPNGVLNYDLLSGDRTLIGYIYGGISSSEPNIFFINDGIQSTASSTIYAVYIQKKAPTSTKDNVNSKIQKLKVFPNPTDQVLNFSFFVDKPVNLNWELNDRHGRLIHSEPIIITLAGDYEFSHDFKDKYLNGVYFLSLRDHKDSTSVKVVFENK